MKVCYMFFGQNYVLFVSKEVYYIWKKKYIVFFIWKEHKNTKNTYIILLFTSFPNSKKKQFYKQDMSIKGISRVSSQERERETVHFLKKLSIEKLF